MPLQALRPCKLVGCPNLTRNTYCDLHKREQRNNYYDKNRPTATQRGYNYKWTQQRTKYLRNNPLCVRCAEKDLITIATVVDHIVPHKGDMDLFWDESNWQSLCKRCHDIKTATEDGGFGHRG